MPRRGALKSTASRCLAGLALLAMLAASVAGARVKISPGALKSSASKGHGRSLKGGSSTYDINDVVTNIIQTFCQQQSGAQCDAIDLSGTSSWWLSNPKWATYPTLNIQGGMDPPVVPQGQFQVTGNKTTGFMFCPWRPFKYTCELDKWAIAQSIETTTTNAGWSVGSTRSVQVTAGFEFLGEGVQVGLTASFSFAYNFQNSTATAQASQNTFTEGLQTIMDPASGNCVIMTSNMQTVAGNGTQTAFVSATGFVGVYQNQAVPWLGMDQGAPQNAHVFPLPYALLQLAQSEQIDNTTYDGLDLWTYIASNASLARIDFPIALSFNLGINGTTSSQAYSKASSTCTSNDKGGQQVAHRRLHETPAQAQAAYADEIVGHKYINGELLPVIRPRRMA